ncbi:hypothetical protein F4821DRAFT_8664 [Hypoxylon rubiginosum]|uniref:Uncharacterized protein n=1 Tax=Hypoxylon rubiginosum TaxID=110542 RepID=A0ACC0DM50_9PEZI|nr:hypothetical protein F4821DRAFT_8664 [Hypoxylon rubiginosum]
MWLVMLWWNVLVDSLNFAHHRETYRRCLTTTTRLVIRNHLRIESSAQFQMFLDCSNDYSIAILWLFREACRTWSSCRLPII